MIFLFLLFPKLNSLIVSFPYNCSVLSAIRRYRYLTKLRGRLTEFLQNWIPIQKFNFPLLLKRTTELYHGKSLKDSGKGKRKYNKSKETGSGNWIWRGYCDSFRNMKYGRISGWLSGITLISFMLVSITGNSWQSVGWKQKCNVSYVPTLYLYWPFDELRRWNMNRIV